MAGLHPKCGEPFDFKRLGLRTSAMLISPWVGRGTVFQKPKGPTPTSQFELTSVASTVKNLFNLSSFLTKRDAWAGSFDELLLDTPREESDMPMQLPPAPHPSSPWLPPPGSEAEGEQRVGRRVASERHCSSWHGGQESECRSPSETRHLKMPACQSNVITVIQSVFLSSFT